MSRITESTAESGHLSCSRFGVAYRRKQLPPGEELLKESLQCRYRSPKATRRRRVSGRRPARCWWRAGRRRRELIGSQALQNNFKVDHSVNFVRVARKGYGPDQVAALDQGVGGLILRRSPSNTGSVAKYNWVV